MKKWEYMEINVSNYWIRVEKDDFHSYLGVKRPPEVVKVNGSWLQPEKIEQKRGQYSRAIFPRFWDYLNKLGEEGWELVLKRDTSIQLKDGNPLPVEGYLFKRSVVD